MEPSIEPVDISQKQTLKNLLSDYQKEILNTDNAPDYKYLDSYWEVKNRFPFFIKLNGQIIGFVLVNDYAILEKGAMTIAEFYIIPKFRQKKFGSIAAFKTFDKFLSKWEIRQLKENAIAISFWRSVIDKYTNHNFDEKILNDQNWHGPVQIFESHKI